MLKKLKSFARGLVQLVQQPTIIEDTQKALLGVKEHAMKDIQRVTGENQILSSNLQFYKRLGDWGLAIGKVLFDRRTGMCSTIQGFEIASTGVHMVWLYPDKVPAKRLFDDMTTGVIELLEPAQVEGRSPLPTSFADINKRLQPFGLVLDGLEAGTANGAYMLRFKNTVSGAGLSLAGSWDTVEGITSQLEDGDSCGIIAYPGGDWTYYVDSAAYMTQLKENFNCLGPGSFSMITLTKDPQVRKAVDDMIYGEYGEENPHDLDYYRSSSQQQAATVCPAPVDELEFEP